MRDEEEKEREEKQQRGERQQGGRERKKEGSFALGVRARHIIFDADALSGD